MADYDFIIVGSGPAGSALAYGLSKAASKPRILLLEAGGDNNDRDLRIDGRRWLTFLNADMNWGYKTAPQAHCAGRELDYSRGRGLGGSSAINFGVFTIGARGDYEEWARVTGDDTFGWDRMQARLKSLETLHPALPDGVSAKYAAPQAANHGASGPLHVGYAAEWETDLPQLLDAFEEAGLPLNPDHNSGDPIGMSVLISSAHKGLRSTARDLLMQVPDNLTVLTGSPVKRVVLEGKRAVGVELIDGTVHRPSKEVILCAGALDTPRILMHSGIGPADQLEKFQIPVVHSAPAVGQGLRDHAFCPLVYKRTPSSTARASFYGDQAAMDAAFAQWKKDGSGPWAKFACEMGIGFFKSPALEASPEFQSLPPNEKRYLTHPTVPHYEVFTHFPMHWFLPNFPQDDSLNYSCLIVFLYNAQARGEATLQSADPVVPLRFDPDFLGTAFDRRVAIESLREMVRFAKSPAYAKDTIGVLAAPPSDADEDLLTYWQQTISSSWHMTGTTKMGKLGEADAVVDPDFRVVGIQGLRVVDMSVVPVLASGHVQAVAYVTGLTCAEELINEYGL